MASNALGRRDPDEPPPGTNATPGRGRFNPDAKNPGQGEDSSIGVLGGDSIEIAADCVPSFTRDGRFRESRPSAFVGLGEACGGRSRVARSGTGDAGWAPC